MPTALTPLVSVITPTHGRAAFLRGAWHCLQAQTHRHWEWLILDDSPQPDPWLSTRPDDRIRYRHDPLRATIGAKRNHLMGEARGEYIAHFDDDDYYSPTYLEEMVAVIAREGVDMANLCAWYLYDARHDFLGFWDLRTTTGLHYGCYQDGLKIFSLNAGNNAAFADNHLGYGFSYVYRRELARRARFGDVSWNEELAFRESARGACRLAGVQDRPGLALHILHTGSSSSCFPQYHLPTFLLPTLFPGLSPAHLPRALGGALGVA